MKEILTQEYWQGDLLRFKSELDEIDLYRYSYHLNTGDYNATGEGKTYFLAESGKEHYRLLSYISAKLNNTYLLDVGALYGYSALAFATNPANTVYSVDVAEHYSIINPPKNIKYFLSGNFKAYAEIVMKSDVILIDTYHMADFEDAFLKFLEEKNYKGLVLLDDLYVNAAMKNWWESITLPKLDVTKIGHTTGTGMVFFN